MGLQAGREPSMSNSVKTLHMSHARARELLTRGLKANPPRLDWSACSVASLVDDDFTVEEVEDRLDDLGRRVQEGLPAEAEAPEQLSALRRVLVEEEGFSGGSAVDDGPVNSALHHVLARKTGLPIALSVVYLEVARRAGVPLVGVSFPAHFLVATPGAGNATCSTPSTMAGSSPGMAARSCSRAWPRRCVSRRVFSRRRPCKPLLPACSAI